MADLHDIMKLDLSFVESRLINREKWDPKKAKEAVRRYKNFLVLRFKYPSLIIIPAPDIDEVWHAHILFTQEYTDTCQKIFGKYLHHAAAEDYSDKEAKIRQTAMHKTAEIYFKEFNESYLRQLNIKSLWYT